MGTIILDLPLSGIDAKSILMSPRLPSDQMADDPESTRSLKGIDRETGKSVRKRSLFERLLHRAEKPSPPEGDEGPYMAVDPLLDQKVRMLDDAFREKPPTDY